MKIDTTVALTDLKGEQIKNNKGEVLFSQTVMVDSLLATHQGETPTGKEKFERYELAKKISDAKGTVEISAEEATKLKDMIAKSWAPIVVGRMYELIEK